MTGYVVHYSDGDTDRNESVAASSNYCNLIYMMYLSKCVTYTISVEATSEHLSGVSNEWNITLRMKNDYCIGLFVITLQVKRDCISRCIFLLLLMLYCKLQPSFLISFSCFDKCIFYCCE